jgi:catechol 2,3-dioxygenase-like lactoylglutathione lyase family enzyme
MKSTTASTMTGKTSVAKQLRFSGFSHMSLPCRDLAESKRFYMDVMGGELVHDVPGFAEVRIADVIIGISQQVEGWTPWNAEFPHYAFFIDAENFLPMVDWLRQNGVTTSEPWTRDGIKGLLYFRDPSGNLLEMYCPKIKAAETFARGRKQGGNYEVDFAALNYKWQGD